MKYKKITKEAYDGTDKSKFMIDELFIGSSGNLKPSKKRNYHKALVWITIIVITITLAVIWFVALTKFKHG